LKTWKVCSRLRVPALAGFSLGEDRLKAELFPWCIPTRGRTQSGRTSVPSVKRRVTLVGHDCVLPLVGRHEAKQTYFIHEKHEKHEPYTGPFRVFRVVRGQVSTRIPKLELGNPRKDLSVFFPKN